MSFSKLAPEDLTHVFIKKGQWMEEFVSFPRCRPCGKYCACTKTKTDERGFVHRSVCCQCALRPSKLWNYPLKRVLCEHAPPYNHIRYSGRDTTTMTLEAAVAKLSLSNEETWDDVVYQKPEETQETEGDNPKAVPNAIVEAQEIDETWDDAFDAFETRGAETPRIIVVDIQWFVNNAGDFIVKELAAVEVLGEDVKGIETTTTAVPIVTLFWTTVQSPYDVNELNNRAYANYRYISERHHGLSWEEGTVSADVAFRLLRAAIHNTESKDRERTIVVYAKGYEKVNYIADRIWHGRVLDYSGPSLKKMESPKCTPLCPTHSKMSMRFMCSLNNCYKIAAHYRSRQRQEQ